MVLESFRWFWTSCRETFQDTSGGARKPYYVKSSLAALDRLNHRAIATPKLCRSLPHVIISKLLHKHIRDAARNKSGRSCCMNTYVVCGVGRWERKKDITKQTSKRLSNSSYWNRTQTCFVIISCALSFPILAAGIGGFDIRAHTQSERHYASLKRYNQLREEEIFISRNAFNFKMIKGKSLCLVW